VPIELTVRLCENSSNFEVGISKLLSQIATGKIPVVSEMNSDSPPGWTARLAGRFTHRILKWSALSRWSLRRPHTPNPKTRRCLLAFSLYSRQLGVKEA
jgi:hypothetical protein